MQTVTVNAGTTYTTAANQWGLVGWPAGVLSVLQPGQSVRAGFAQTVRVGTQVEILAAYKAVIGTDWTPPPAKSTHQPPQPQA